jgi:hypothetical protein
MSAAQVFPLLQRTISHYVRFARATLTMLGSVGGLAFQVEGDQVRRAL